MKDILFCLIFLLATIANTVCAQTPPALYVGTGTNIFISAGTTFSTDSLVLTPSADFNIQGVNAVAKTASLLHASSNSAIKRIFQFSNTTLPFSGSIAVYYVDAELNGISETSLTLNIHNGANWNSFNTNVTRDAVNNFVHTANLANQSLNELTLAALLAPLPVRFLSVNALCKTNGVLLKWQTAIENNSQRFDVQQSPDGISWRLRGSIPAAGMSSDPRSYDYFDNSPGGNGWYRIVEFDADNRTTISATIKSSCLLSTGVSLFPNPVLETAYLNITSATTSAVILKLYDARGALVKSEQHALSTGTNLVSINLQGLARGWYTLAVQSNSTTGKFTILKQ